MLSAATIFHYPMTIVVLEYNLTFKMNSRDVDVT